MKKPRPLDSVRQNIHRHNYSLRTEQAYVSWIRRYIFFHDKKHPQEMGEEEIVQFLNYLAKDQRTALSTQKQALNALVFFVADAEHRTTQVVWPCPGEVG